MKVEENKLIVAIKYADGSTKFRPAANQILPSLQAIDFLIRFFVTAALSESRIFGFKISDNVSGTLLESKRGSFIQIVSYVIEKAPAAMESAICTTLIKEVVKCGFGYLHCRPYAVIKKYKPFTFNELNTLESNREALENQLAEAYRPITKDSRNKITIETGNKEVMVTLDYNTLKDLQFEEEIADNREMSCFVAQFNGRSASGRLVESLKDRSHWFETHKNISSDEKDALILNLRSYTKALRSNGNEQKVKVRCNRVLRKDGTIKRYSVLHVLPDLL